MKREFKGIWIPKEIWLNRNLSLSEKLMLVEIDSFDNSFGCVASNKTLCEDLQIKPSTASGIIKSLEKKGFLSVFYRDQNTCEGRVIKFLGTPFGNPKPPSEKSGGPSEKSEHSNTFSNTLSKNEDSKLSSVGLPEVATPTVVKPIANRCRLFVDKFNEIRLSNGKKSKFKSNKMIEGKLSERLKEKYAPKDIIKVIGIAIKDDYHIQSKLKYVTPEYILRPAILDRYLNLNDQEITSNEPKNYVP